MAMRLDTDGLVQYISQWIRDTAHISLADPLVRQFANMAYLESADRGMWKVECASLNLTAGKGEYTMTELGVTDMIRPFLVLLDGKKLPDTDYESMSAAGCFDPGALTGDPLYVNFQTGDMTIRPIPDATAAAKTLKIIYAASPAELVTGGLLDGKFRTAWQEIVAWLVLKRVAITPRDEESQKLFMTPDQVNDECEKRLKKLREDVWSTAVSSRKIKDRSQDVDVAYLNRNFVL